MRALALLLLVALALPACDSTTTTEPPPEEVPVGVLLRYRASVSGEANTAAVTYTTADGTSRTEALDLERTRSFVIEIPLEPGTEGTFTLSVTGIVTDGSMSASVAALRADDETEIAFDIETATATGTEEIGVSVEAVVPVIYETDAEA